MQNGSRNYLIKNKNLAYQIDQNKSQEITQRIHRPIRTYISKMDMSHKVQVQYSAAAIRALSFGTLLALLVSSNFCNKWCCNRIFFMYLVYVVFSL